MGTFMAKASEVERQWYIVDVEGQTLGRVATKIASILAGKNKPVYTRHVDTGDHVIVINAAKVVQLNSDEKLKQIINSCQMINADGKSIVWASKILGKSIPERVSGIDLMYKIIKLANEKEYGIYFFGAKDEVVKSVIHKVKKEYPNVKISGFRNGYFKDEQNDLIVEDIRNSNADILFIAFSSPQKEYWLSQNINKLNVPFCMGVGGSFDIVAGITKRAPLWMQELGLEWFYRFKEEPKRMWKRYLVGNTKFCLLLFKEYFRIRIKKE